MSAILLKNGTIINEGEQFQGSILIEDRLIKKIFRKEPDPEYLKGDIETVECAGKILMPGVIDDQVHFREPGLTHKADIQTESRAAAAGGITSFMEMPNTMPQTINQEELEAKYELGASKSAVNYSFYFGATNDNIEELRKCNPENVCGIKVFMGASTGNMLVDNRKTLESIFSETSLPVAVHCEDEPTIRANIAKYKSLYGEDVPIKMHPLIRSEEACYRSSSLAVELATKYNTRLHILHISTARELSLFNNTLPLAEKRITAEVCVHHLWFDDHDYETKGTMIKWNPAIKTEQDKNSLFEGVLNNKLDVIATDHAPHTLVEKSNTYFKAPSGGPLVQHSLPAMLEFYHQKKISLENIVEKMCHAPAILFNIRKRGFIREGYYADLVVVSPDHRWKVEKENILYKCGWSPFEGTSFHSAIYKTYVNGTLVYDDGKLTEKKAALRLAFDR